MSSTEEPEGRGSDAAEPGADAAPDSGPGTAEDQAYFRALEEHLLDLRGKTTLLAPADWQAAVEWRRRGIPLDLVRSVMSELAAKRRARGSKRGVASLRYFRAAVEAAWEEQLELGAGGVAPRFDPGPPVAARLAALAAAIPKSSDSVELEAVRAELALLSGEMEEIEAALVALDQRLLAAAAAALSAERRARIDARVEAALRAVAAGLPAEESETLRERLRAQALREEARLPHLSLFAPAALAASTGASVAARDE